MNSSRLRFKTIKQQKEFWRSVHWVSAMATEQGLVADGAVYPWAGDEAEVLLAMGGLDGFKAWKQAKVANLIHCDIEAGMNGSEVVAIRYQSDSHKCRFTWHTPDKDNPDWRGSFVRRHQPHRYAKRPLAAEPRGDLP